METISQNHEIGSEQSDADDTLQKSNIIRALSHGIDENKCHRKT